MCWAPKTYGLDAETATALRVYAERYYTGWVKAFDELAAQLRESGKITESEAKQVAEAYLRQKLVRFDLVNQRFTVKHGGYWDRDAIRNALGNVRQTPPDNEQEREAQDTGPGSRPVEPPQGQVDDSVTDQGLESFVISSAVRAQSGSTGSIPADESGGRATTPRQPRRLQKPDTSKGSVKPARSRQQAAQPETPNGEGTHKSRPASPQTHRAVRPVPRTPAIGKKGRKVNPLAGHPLARLGRRRHGVR